MENQLEVGLYIGAMSVDHMLLDCITYIPKWKKTVYHTWL